MLRRRTPVCNKWSVEFHTHSETLMSMKRLISYFFSGVLIVLPAAATYLVLSFFISKIDNIISLPIPGLGFLIVLGTVTFIGYVGGGWIAKPLLNFIDVTLSRTPFINMIYLSIKDFVEALVGSNRKFDHPVLMDLDGNQTYRIGFLTQRDLNVLGLEDYVGVYVPHSYNFSGNFFVIPRTRIRELPISATDIMRFAVSAGVVEIEKSQRDIGTDL